MDEASLGCDPTLGQISILLHVSETPRSSMVTKGQVQSAGLPVLLCAPQMKFKAGSPFNDIILGPLLIEPPLFAHINSLAFLAPGCLISQANYEPMSIMLPHFTPRALFLSNVN